MRRTSFATGSILVAALCLTAPGQTNPTAPTQSSEAPTMEFHGMPPRANPTDYQAQVHAGAVTIAAEFKGHSVPRPEGPLSTEDYVVVETAFYGPEGQKLKLSLDDFSLNINGKKSPLPSQSYVVVLRSLRDPEWVAPGELEAKKESKTSLNGSSQTENGPPPPVHVPIELQRAWAQDAKKAALPVGDRVLPQAGLIFFEYRGKVKGIHSLELIYSGPAGKTSLKLQP
jgi:hypothetical protein